MEIQKIRDIINDAKKKVKIGGKYSHYKKPDKYYIIHNVGVIEGSLEPCVVYEALYNELKGIVWVRPLNNFIETLEIKGKKVSRFTFIE